MSGLREEVAQRVRAGTRTHIRNVYGIEAVDGGHIGKCLLPVRLGFGAISRVYRPFGSPVWVLQGGGPR